MIISHLIIHNESHSISSPRLFFFLVIEFTLVLLINVVETDFVYFLTYPILELKEVLLLNFCTFLVHLFAVQLHYLIDILIIHLK